MVAFCFLTRTHSPVRQEPGGLCWLLSGLFCLGEEDLLHQEVSPQFCVITWSMAGLEVLGEVLGDL